MWLFKTLWYTVCSWYCFIISWSSCCVSLCAAFGSASYVATWGNRSEFGTMGKLISSLVTRLVRWLCLVYVIICVMLVCLIIYVKSSSSCVLFSLQPFVSLAVAGSPRYVKLSDVLYACHKGFLRCKVLYFVDVSNTFFPLCDVCGFAGGLGGTLGITPFPDSRSKRNFFLHILHICTRFECSFAK